MEINGLVVLHNTKGSSDKVWGYFKNGDGEYYKYWGKRLGNRFQTQPVSISVLLEDEPKKKKKGYVCADLGVVTSIKDKLAVQFGVSTTDTKKVKSKVTGDLMEAPIRPSQVARTEERIDRDDPSGEWALFFYDEHSTLLGKRPVSQKEVIFSHLRKTKDDGKTTTDSSGSPTYIDWKEKEPATI